MPFLKVTAPKINIRTAPVEDFTDKSNVIGKLFKDARFESVSQRVNKLGAWHQDRNNHWAWEGGFSETISEQDSLSFDFQAFINASFDGQTLKSEINYLAALEIDETIKSGKGENIVIGILDHPISSSINFINPIEKPFHINDPLFNFHGNFISGIIGGTNGILGISNKCKFLELPIFNARASSGGIDIDAVLNFINKDDTPMIVNISNRLDRKFNDTIKNFKSNKIVVACAGIDEELAAVEIRDPASQPNVLVVGAITKPLKLLPKLNDKIDFVLPNYDFVSFKNSENIFSKASGDSFSCASISAIIALLISSGKTDFNLTNIKNELKKIALPFSTESLSSFNLINVKP
jgi:hypothetical protein